MPAPTSAPSQMKRPAASVISTPVVKLVKKSKPTPRALLLFSGGNSSVAKTMQRMGYEVVTVDWDPSKRPTICANIRKIRYANLWDFGDFDVVWARPEPAHFSKAKTRGERDLVSACALVQRALDIIDHIAPRLWFLENPAYGLLPKQDTVAGIPFAVADYCQYIHNGKKRMPYKKSTAFWSNGSLRLWRCQGAGRCPVMASGKHKSSVGNGRNRYTKIKRSFSKDNHVLPSELVEDLLNADLFNWAYLTPTDVKIVASF